MTKHRPPKDRTEWSESPSLTNLARRGHAAHEPRGAAPHDWTVHTCGWFGYEFVNVTTTAGAWICCGQVHTSELQRRNRPLDSDVMTAVGTGGVVYDEDRVMVAKKQEFVDSHGAVESAPLLLLLVSTGNIRG